MGEIDGVNERQSAVLALFVIFAIMVFFIGKTGTDVWSTLFTHYDYDAWIGPIHIIQGKNLPPSSTAASTEFVTGVKSPTDPNPIKVIVK